MKRIHLIRHAKSSWDDASLDDHDRPLAPRGVRAARAMGLHLASCGVSFDRVLCSSAKRARETLDLVLEPLAGSPKISHDEELYLATAGQMLARLRRLDENTRSVLLVGHHPGLADLALLLLDAADPWARKRLARKLPTGAWVEIHLSAASWPELAPGRGRLGQLVRPKTLLRG